MNRRQTSWRTRPQAKSGAVRWAVLALCAALAYASAPRCQFTKALFEMFVSVAVTAPLSCHQATASEASDEASESAVTQASHVFRDAASCQCAYDEYLRESLPRPRSPWHRVTSPQLTLLFSGNPELPALDIEFPFLETDHPPPRAS